MDWVVAGGGCDSCVKVVVHEEYVEVVARCHAEEVNIDISLDCDGCFGVPVEDRVNGFLEVCSEVWVVMRAAIDVDDGVYWIGSLFCVMNLEGDDGCLWDVDVIEEGGEEV